MASCKPLSNAIIYLTKLKIYLYSFIYLSIHFFIFSFTFTITCFLSLGLGQGIRRSFIGIATILAPLWAGSTFDMPYVMVGVMLVLVGLSLVS